MGRIVEQSWKDLPNHYPGVTLGHYRVMPNHFYGIVMLVENPNTDFSNTNGGAGFKPAPPSKKRYPLSEIVRGFKTFSSRRVNEFRSTLGVPVWQRNYYERVIRGENELCEIRQYIQENPLKWDLDPENPYA